MHLRFQRLIRVLGGSDDASICTCYPCPLKNKREQKEGILKLRWLSLILAAVSNYVIIIKSPGVGNLMTALL